MIRSRALGALALAAALGAAACSSTEFVQTWTAPDAAPLRLTGSSVVAVFMTRKPGLRRSAEDAMAKEISARGARGVASYTILPDEFVRDEKLARGTFERFGFAGSVTMRVVGNETQYSYTPSYWSSYPYYGSYWGGYWGWGWGAVYQPGYLTAEKVVSIESLVYSFRQNKLVFAGVSKTTDPESVDETVSELASEISSKLKDAGLL
jgi:hypothetical protein